MKPSPRAVRFGVTLVAVLSLAVGATGTVAADHDNNHCEHHQEGGGVVSDVVDWALDNAKQNMCNGGGTTADAIGFTYRSGACAADCFEEGR